MINGLSRLSSSEAMACQPLLDATLWLRGPATSAMTCLASCSSPDKYRYMNSYLRVSIDCYMFTYIAETKLDLAAGTVLSCYSRRALTWRVIPMLILKVWQSEADAERTVRGRGTGLALNNVVEACRWSGLESASLLMDRRVLCLWAGQGWPGIQLTEPSAEQPMAVIWQ